MAFLRSGSWVIFFLALTGEAQAFRVVIDPGHGGINSGTSYLGPQGRLLEKDLTLKLSRQVAYQLRSQGFQVHLTRTTDQDVPLAERTAFANRLKADVFLSLHLNSAPTDHPTEAGGVETFILNNATDASSRRLAELENTLISENPDPSPEQADVALILKDLRLDANLTQSKSLACLVQNALVSHSPRHFPLRKNRGVKQALFHVLLGADMPSILVEVGFLSHASDRTYLLSPKGQNAISRAIAQAVQLYKTYQESPNPRTHQRAFSRALKINNCKIN